MFGQLRDNLKMCACADGLRGAYECARCRTTCCMVCDRPRDADERKTIVRYCPDWRCQREMRIENGSLVVSERGDR